MLNYKEIAKESPKAWALLKEWTAQKLLKMQTLMTQGAVKIEDLPPISDEIVEGTLMWNHRVLIDFAEENNLKLSLGFSKEKDYFYSIQTDSSILEEKDGFSSRPSMEEGCLSNIFKFI